MSTRSRNDLINEILQYIGVLAAGQTANVEDTTRVQDMLPSVQPMLMAMEIGYIPDFDAIAEHSFIPLAQICAYICRVKFGVTGDDEVALEKIFGQGVTALKVIYRGRPTYQPLQTDYI